MRRRLIAAMEGANVLMLRDNALVAPFLDGRGDIPFTALGMDSLAAMELCIAIELDLGVSIAPDALAQFATLGTLVQRLCDGLPG